MSIINRLNEIKNDLRFGIDKSGATTINISPEKRREAVMQVFEDNRVFDYVTLYENIKGGDAVPLLNAPINLVKTNACGFQDTSDLIISDLVLNPSRFVAGVNICPEDLVKTAFERYLPAGTEVEELTNQELIINYIIGRLKESVAKMVVSGDGSLPNQIDGLVTIGLASTSAIQVTGTTITSANAIAELYKIYEAMPAAIKEAQNRPVIMINHKWLGLAVINSYNNNNYIYAIREDGSGGFILPGTNVRVQAFSGIPDHKAIATSAYYLAVGTDLISDTMEFDVFYSRETRTIKAYAAMRLAAGIAFQNQLVKYS